MIKVLGSLLLLTWTVFTMDGAIAETRGIRNHNPANLVLTNIKWQGKLRCSDTRFECFSTPFHGLRAMYKTLYSYYYKHNKQSIREIMHRWSPAHENETEDIVRRVSRRMGWLPNATIPIDDTSFLFRLGSSLVINENSDDPYTEKLHRRAIEDAYRNNNNVRQYLARRSTETVVDVSKGKGRAAEGSYRERYAKEGSSTRSTRGKEPRNSIYAKSNSTGSNLLNHSIPINNCTNDGTNSNTRLDRVAERIPILHRWKGCNDLEGGSRFSDNATPYPSSSRNLWAILRRQYRRQPIIPIYISLV